jgi:hypothetical protein
MWAYTSIYHFFGGFFCTFHFFVVILQIELIKMAQYAFI